MDFERLDSGGMRVVPHERKPYIRGAMRLNAVLKFVAHVGEQPLLVPPRGRNYNRFFRGPLVVPSLAL